MFNKIAKFSSCILSIIKKGRKMIFHSFSGGYHDAAYDDEYPEHQPYPHPGIRGLQYGGDGRQYGAGGDVIPQWGFQGEQTALTDDEVDDVDNRMSR